MGALALYNTAVEYQVIDSDTFEFISSVSYDTVAELCVTKFNISCDSFNGFYLGDCYISISTVTGSDCGNISNMQYTCTLIVNIDIQDTRVKINSGLVSRDSLKPYRVFFKKLNNCIKSNLGYHFIAMLNTEVPVLDVDVPYSKPFKLLVFNKQCHLVCILDSRNLHNYNKYYCSDSKFATLASWLPLIEIQKMLFNKIP